MDGLLQSLEGLFIGAIPTMIFFLLLWAAYNSLVYKPLKRVLQQRYERTEGALVRARADIAAAEAKSHEYESKLRDAKLAIFKAQELRRQQLAAQRDQLIAEARTQAQMQVRDARAVLEKELEQNKATLQQQSGQLAEQVIRAVLRPVAAAPVGGRS